MTAFLAQLGRELCARTCNDDHLALVRMATVRPITGSPLTGWRF